jgi:hypothetical protein
MSVCDPSLRFTPLRVKLDRNRSGADITRGLAGGHPANLRSCAAAIHTMTHTPPRARTGKAGCNTRAIAAFSLLVVDLLRIGHVHALCADRAGVLRHPVGRSRLERRATPRRSLYRVRPQRRDPQISDLAQSRRWRGAVSGLPVRHSASNWSALEIPETNSRPKMASLHPFAASTGL